MKQFRNLAFILGFLFLSVGYHSYGSFSVSAHLNEEVDDSNPILKLVLIRHAESEENVAFDTLRNMFKAKETRKASVRESFKFLNFFNKKLRDTELSVDGLEMAKDVCEQIKEAEVLPWPSIEMFWHSPLKRTEQTMSLLFRESIDQFQIKEYLREMRPIEALIKRPFNERVETFRHDLCEIPYFVECIAVTGHGFFFKRFLGLHRKILNVEIIVCDFNRNTGEVLTATPVFYPEVFKESELSAHEESEQTTSKLL